MQSHFALPTKNTSVYYLAGQTSMDLYIMNLANGVIFAQIFLQAVNGTERTGDYPQTETRPIA